MDGAGSGVRFARSSWLSQPRNARAAAWHKILRFVNPERIYGLSDLSSCVTMVYVIPSLCCVLSPVVYMVPQGLCSMGNLGWSKRQREVGIHPARGALFERFAEPPVRNPHLCFSDGVAQRGLLARGSCHDFLAAGKHPLCLYFPPVELSYLCLVLEK